MIFKPEIRSYRDNLMEFDHGLHGLQNSSNRSINRFDNLFKICVNLRNLTHFLMVSSFICASLRLWFNLVVRLKSATSIQQGGVIFSFSDLSGSHWFLKSGSEFDFRFRFEAEKTPATRGDEGSFESRTQQKISPAAGSSPHRALP